jgi:phosphoglucomutase
MKRSAGDALMCDSLSLKENAAVAAQRDQELLEQVRRGITAYLSEQNHAGLITGEYLENALAHTIPNLTNWLGAKHLDEVSPNLRAALRESIAHEQWQALTNAFSRKISFGTGGIREKMGPNRDVVLRLQQHGVHAPIVKGPNTINDVTLLLTSAGVAKFGLSLTPKLSSVVIGCDSRVCGEQFARLIAQLFLAYEYTVYLFDEPCMYPSVTFAVPTLKADVGVYISASHNDFRYNGFKLSCQNGSQFDPAQRKDLYENFITQVEFTDIRLKPLSDAPPEKLWFLGGEPTSQSRTIQGGALDGLPLSDPIAGDSSRYAGREGRVIDLHTLHFDHLKSFIVSPDDLATQASSLSIAFCAFNGSGRKAVPRLLSEVGFANVRRIMKLDALDGMFPSFCSDPGNEQQPDPGDWRAADIAVKAFQEEYSRHWSDLDLILGTDPDADRCGVIVKVPPHQRDAYPHPGDGRPRDYTLLSADEAWPLILWYRFRCQSQPSGAIADAAKKFIVLSHTTTEALVGLARKFGLGVMKTWVGFAQLAAATRAVWDRHEGKGTEGITDGTTLPEYSEGRTSPEQQRCNRTMHSWEAMEDPYRSINVAALEQSNGYSCLGGPPPDERSLGRHGHVRDKDGTLAALLVAELAAYAKQERTTLLDLLDEKIYLDPDIGLYITYYEPDPIDGEYEGLAGYSKKRGILDRAEDLFERCLAGDTTLGSLPTKGATVYRTGKYDAVNWAGFPDEGYRIYFDQEKRSHLTIRPSGTSNALRFHVQLFGGHPCREEIVGAKAALRRSAGRVVAEVRQLIGAPA